MPNHWVTPLSRILLIVVQILTFLEIIIPMPQLLAMFKQGVQAMSATNTCTSKSNSDSSAPIPLQSVAPPDVHVPEACSSPFSAGNIHSSAATGEEEPRVFNFEVPQPIVEEYKNVACFIMMLDIILKQVRVCIFFCGLPIDCFALRYKFMIMNVTVDSNCTKSSGYLNCFGLRPSYRNWNHIWAYPTILDSPTNRKWTMTLTWAADIMRRFSN